MYSKNLFSLCTIKCAVVPIQPLKYTSNGCQLRLEKGHLIFASQVTLWNCRLGTHGIQCLNLHSKSTCYSHIDLLHIRSYNTAYTVQLCTNIVSCQNIQPYNRYHLSWSLTFIIFIILKTTL